MKTGMLKETPKMYEKTFVILMMFCCVTSNRGAKFKDYLYMTTGVSNFTASVHVWSGSYGPQWSLAICCHSSKPSCQVMIVHCPHGMKINRDFEEDKKNKWLIVIFLHFTVSIPNGTQKRSMREWQNDQSYSQRRTNNAFEVFSFMVVFWIFCIHRLTFRFKSVEGMKIN